MLRPRIIPCLLLHNGSLVKTVQFGDPKYVGDPLNAVRIFNELEVDELIVLDIDAARTGAAPNETLIAQMAAECRMPLCYGGGVKNIEQFERLISLGVEKVAVSSAAVQNPELIARAAERVGSQSVVAVIDVKYAGFPARPTVFTLNGTKKTKLNLIEFIKELERLGSGEIVVNSIDRDGTRSGYDLALASQVRREVNLPLTMLGGAGSIDHLRELVSQHPVIGAAAGSLFVLKGKYRAVMISYLTENDRNMLHGYVLELKSFNSS